MRIIRILCISFVLFCSSGLSSVEKTVSPPISVEESTLYQPLNAGVANQVYVITDPSDEKRILKMGLITRRALGSVKVAPHS